MPCNCKRSNKPGQIRSSTLPRTPVQFSQVQFPTPDLPPNQAQGQNPSDTNTLDSERRRIEKLRRDAVRRSLGIG